MAFRWASRSTVSLKSAKTWCTSIFSPKLRSFVLQYTHSSDSGAAAHVKWSGGPSNSALPYDILTLIFEFVSDTQTLFNACLVCKVFDDAANRILWQRVTDDPLRSKLITMEKTRCQLIRSLSWDKLPKRVNEKPWDWRAWNRFFSRMHNLRTFHVTNTHFIGSSSQSLEAMLQTLSQLPKLEEISLEVSWWRMFLTDTSCIRNLCQIPSLKRLGNVTPDVVASMDDHRLSHITSLRVGSGGELGPLVRLRNLQLLDLSFPELRLRSSSTVKELLNLRHLTNVSLVLTGVLEDCSIKALPSLEHLAVAASRSWDSRINVIDFMAQFTCGAALKNLTFKCQLKFRETISFWKVVSRHAHTLVSLSAPWWYPTTDILRRLGTDFLRLQDLVIGRMCCLDLTAIGLFICLRRIDVYNHDRLGLALTRSNIRALLRQAAPSLNAFGESQTTTQSQSRLVKLWKMSRNYDSFEGRSISMITTVNEPALSVPK